MRIFTEKETGIEPVLNKKVAVIGYGGQGRAHSLNLRDSGVQTVVGLRRDSPAFQKTKNDDVKALEMEEAADWADIIMMLIPDEIQGEVYNKSIGAYMKKGKTLLFAHGFNIHYGFIKTAEDIDVAMVAPKGVGHMVRKEFERGAGVPCLVAVHQNHSGKAQETVLAYASAIGGSRAAIIETTFQFETEADLFGEQAVLCGGMNHLMKAGFDTLVEAGYPPEMAYFECIHELKLVVDLVYERGISGMREAISNTAEYGDYCTGPYLIDENLKIKMKKVLEKIQNGEFAKQWMNENKTGKKNFFASRKKWADLPMEKTGKELRELMPWMKK